MLIIANLEVLKLSIFDNMEKRREEIGVTRKFIATKLELTDSVWQDWKKGKSSPNQQQLETVAKWLWTTPEYLKGESNQKEILPASEQLSQEERNIIAWYRIASEFDKGRVYGILESYEKNNADTGSVSA